MALGHLGILFRAGLSFSSVAFRVATALLLISHSCFSQTPTNELSVAVKKPTVETKLPIKTAKITRIGEQLVVDLGQLRVENIFSIELEMVNQTEREIAVGDFRTDCGCTVATFGTKNETSSTLSVAPGNSFPLLVQLSTKKMNIGAISKQIRVSTDETQNEHLFTVVLKADVICPIVVSVSDSHFSANEATKEILVVAKTDQPDVDLTKAKVLFSGDWVDSYKIVTQSSSEIQMQSSLRIPNDETNENSVQNLRIIFQEGDREVLRNFPIQMHFDLPLIARPRKLILIEEPGSALNATVMLVGHFDTQSLVQLKISLLKNDEPIKSFDLESKAINSRLLQLKLSIAKSIIERYEAEDKMSFEIHVGDEIVKVPAKISGTTVSP
jgi:Protein of unknown function (DUF1573)